MDSIFFFYFFISLISFVSPYFLIFQDSFLYGSDNLHSMNHILPVRTNSFVLIFG